MPRDQFYFSALARRFADARKAFDCGDPILNEYLQKYSSQHVRQRHSLVNLLVERETEAVRMGS